MPILTITETIYTIISLVVRIILAIYDYKQNKNNLDGRKPMVIFLYILLRISYKIYAFLNIPVFLENIKRE